MVLQTLLHVTNFSSPLLRTVIPTVAAAFALQGAFAVPSIIARSDRFYDFSGAVTNAACVALSLYLPHLRARQALAAGGAGVTKSPLPSLLAPFMSQSGGGAASDFNWRQVVMSAAATIWAVRRTY